MSRLAATGLRRTRLACGLAGALALIGIDAGAQVDAVQLRLLSQFELPLRWDNVEPGRRYWEHGAVPTWRAAAGLHAIRLEPGQSVTVRLPAGETLRLHRLDDTLDLGAVSVSLGSGTGLYRQQRLRPSVGGHDWLLAANDNTLQSAQLARITLADGASSGVDLALFVSRRDALGSIAPYRRLISLPGPTQALRRAVDAASQPYWPLDPSESTELEVTGPARYALRSRLRYPPNESALAQGWHISVRLDQQAWLVLNHDTGADSAQPVWLDGRETLLSREQESYLEVPPGPHRLSLSSSGPLLVRLLQQDDPDYLLPRLNEPTLAAREARQAIEPAQPLLLRLSNWGESASAAAALVADHAASPIRVLAAAQRLYPDNRLRDSAMLAASASLQAANRQRDMPALRGEANEKALLHTFYRDLLPRDQPPAGRQRFAWFLTPRLRGSSESERGTVMAGQHLNQLLQSLGSGVFLPLPDSALAYELPPRFAPSSVRVVVHGDAERPQKIYLQYDQQPPVLLSVLPMPELPGDRFAPTSAEAALVLLAERHGEQGVGTLSGAFGQRHTPGPLIPARIMEVPLPQAVGRIRLWREGGGGAALWLALQLRAAKTFALTERAYLDASGSLRPEAADNVATVAQFMTALSESAPSDAMPSRRELDSHWQPLARVVRAQSRLFNVAIGAPPAVTPAVLGAPTAASRAEALRLAGQGQWLPALEAWSDAAASPLAQERAQALVGQVDALRHLGEDFLAEQLLKQQLLQGPDQPARRRARLALSDFYRQANDPEGLLATHAAALVRDPEADNAEVLVGLSEALLGNDEPALALTAGLLLPAPKRPLETLLRAAWVVEWWQVFDDLVAQLPDPQRQHHWRAQRALTEGRYPDAELEFQQSDREGQAFAAHLRQGRAIQAALASGPETGALADWAQWTAAHPGPRSWRDAAHQVTDFAGTETLYAIDRDLYLTAFRSEPGRPLRLGLAGPVKLRIEARPLHSGTDNARIEGWLNIKSAGRQWLNPITQNAPASGLLLLGRPQMLAGRRVVQDLQLGPGWHEVEAGADDLPLLLRVQTEQPALRLPVLPELTADTARARPLGVTTKPVAAWRARLGACPDCTLLLDGSPDTPARYLQLERQLLDANPTRLAEGAALPTLPTPAVPDEAARRASGQWQALLTWPTDHSDTGLRERLISLLWIGEHQPEHYMGAVALTEAIRAAHPQVAGLSALVDRLGRNSSWTPVAIVQASAGLRSRNIVGWEPEAPALRVRRALLPPMNSNERLLAGDNRLVAAFTNTRPARITLNLGSVDVAALPAQPLLALLQIDQQAPQRIALTPGRPQDQRTLTLPLGRHSLRLWIEAPLANQFLRVRLSEAGRPQFAETVERFYHVATLKEPLRVRLPGPAWVRIDQWRDGHDEVSYRWIEQTWNDLVLPPPGGQHEALFRVHLSAFAAGRSITPARTLNPESTPIPAPTLLITEPLQADPVILEDGLRLGGQEDGTWSLALSRQLRLYGRDGGAAPAGLDTGELAVEKFREFAATYRYFDEDRHTHWRADMLARQPDQGFPTLGLKGLASISPGGTFWNLGLEGSLFVHDGAGHDALPWSWSLGASASQRSDIRPTLWHQPKLSLFWRGSQGEDASARRHGQLDQDIYTPYRAEHRFGVSVGDTLSWRPWLDTEFYASAQATSNEDFNLLAPDRLANTLGWRQLLGPFQWRTQWVGNHYFADAQRRSDSRNSHLSFELTWEHWLHNQERIEMALALKREIDVGQSLLSYSLTWHFGNGRAYRDFRPAEIDFLDLRQRRVPQQQNNKMSDTQ